MVVKRLLSFESHSKNEIIMRKALLIFTFSLITIVFSACERASKIGTSGIHPGMTKNEVTSMLGQPYMTSFKVSDTGVQTDIYTYKETVVHLGSAISLLSILEFKDDSLISMKQKKQRPFPTTTTITETDHTHSFQHDDKDRS